MYNNVKKSKNRQVTYMKPRIFISSTFYDLKYIREDLSNFVRQHDYEPILFENGDIGYTPGKALDKSCYESMKNSDMVILIIGGEYGSAATGEIKDEFKEYMSVTRNEFRTAIDVGIPVFVMIDKRVMTEYNVYELNCEEIENNGQKIKFSSVKNTNVFRFIKEIRSMSILPIQEFEKSTDIKEFIGKQWADMFKNYLASLRGEREDKKIEGSVNELKDLIQQMGIMLDSVGKNVLSKESSDKYIEVVRQQEIISFCNILSENIIFWAEKEVASKKERIFLLNALLKALMNNVYDDKLIRCFTGNIVKELKANGFHIWDMEFANFNFVISKCLILANIESFEKIVNIMVEDKYFNRIYICSAK
jgi:hypothetical protein